MKFPKYIKSTEGQIGSYAYITVGNRPVYRFEKGDFKLRQATTEELTNGSDYLNDLLTEVKTALMQWKRLSSALWEAVGKYGKFQIERSRGQYWVHYASEDMQKNYRPKLTLSEAKDFCERSPYWEEAVNG